jgi:hypothetical protein
MMTVFLTVQPEADDSHPPRHLIPLVGFAFAYDSRQA